jgi:hypothetical protein
MTEYWIVFDPTDADPSIHFGSSPNDGAASQQQPSNGLQALQIGADAYNRYPVALDAIKSFQCNLIETSADVFAANLITFSPRKVQTTAALKEEADTYTSASDPTKFPFLGFLAKASGTTIAQEQATFQEEWARFALPGAAINAASISTQRKILAATTLGGVYSAASTLNGAYGSTLTPATLAAWQAVLAG